MVTTVRGNARSAGKSKSADIPLVDSAFTNAVCTGIHRVNMVAYRSAVGRAGDRALLQQIFVHRAGHCTFTPAETITAIQVLVSRLDTGRWEFSALDPANLNARAAALGPRYNVLDDTAVPAAPAFLRYRPAPFLRPFDLAPGR